MARRKQPALLVLHGADAVHHGLAGGEHAPGGIVVLLLAQTGGGQGQQVYKAALGPDDPGAAVAAAAQHTGRRDDGIDFFPRHGDLPGCGELGGKKIKVDQKIIFNVLTVNSQKNFMEYLFYILRSFLIKHIQYHQFVGQRFFLDQR